MGCTGHFLGSQNIVLDAQGIALGSTGHKLWGAQDIVLGSQDIVLNAQGIALGFTGHSFGVHRTLFWVRQT